MSNDFMESEHWELKCPSEDCQDDCPYDEYCSVQEFKISNLAQLIDDLEIVK